MNVAVIALLSGALWNFGGTFSSVLDENEMLENLTFQASVFPTFLSAQTLVDRVGRCRFTLQKVVRLSAVRWTCSAELTPFLVRGEGLSCRQIIHGDFVPNEVKLLLSV